MLINGRPNLARISALSSRLVLRVKEVVHDSFWSGVRLLQMGEAPSPGLVSDSQAWVRTPLREWLTPSPGMARHYVGDHFWGATDSLRKRRY